MAENQILPPNEVRKNEFNVKKLYEPAKFLRSDGRVTEELPISSSGIDILNALTPELYDEVCPSYEDVNDLIVGVTYKYQNNIVSQLTISYDEKQRIISVKKV